MAEHKWFVADASKDSYGLLEPDVGVSKHGADSSLQHGLLYGIPIAT